MNDLIWHDSFEIGLDFIDRDHRKLFKIIRDTKQAIEEDNCNECIALLTSFLEEAKDHFYREEQLLFETGYPDLEDHRVYHKRLLIKTVAARQICEGVKAGRDLKECFDGMVEFFIDDVMREDIKFKPYLENAGCMPDRRRG